MRRILLLFLLLPFLSACAFSTSQVTPTPTAVTPSSPYDGNWQGIGITSAGREFKIALNVAGAKLNGFTYSFIGSTGIPCTGISYADIPPAQQPNIIDNKVTVNSKADLTFTASFDSDSKSSGHLTVHWHERQPYCNGDYEVDWSATKQIAQVEQPATPQQNPDTPNPFETLIQILVFGLSNGAVLALNAIGVTLIYGTVRALNLAHGDVFALCTAMVTSTVNLIGIQQDWSPLQITGWLFVVMCVTIGFGALLSVGVERLGFAPFRGRSRLAPLIATLGISFILFQGALVWRTLQPSWIPGEHRSVPGLPEVPTDGIPSFLPEINLVKTFGLPFHIIIRFSDVFVVALAVSLVLLAHWFMQKTRTGKAIRALSQGHQMAEMIGINVNQTIQRAFALGGAFAGAAGFIFALYYGRPFGSHGAQSGLFAFMAALLGGIGNPLGALLSGLLIGAFSSLSDYYLNAQWTPTLLLLLLILLFAWKPGGFSGDADSESIQVRDTIILSGSGNESRAKRWLAFVLLVLIFVPLAIHSGQTILLLILIFIILTLGLNLALGIAGMLDLGFAASFGLAAYITALFTAKLDIVVVLLIGAGAGALLGLLKGLLARRLRSDFFAVATLALGLLVRQVIINIPMTGGMGGMGVIAAPHLFAFAFLSQTSKYYLILVLAGLIAWLSYRVIQSRTGRAWTASSEDEGASLSLGVNVGRERIIALMLSSALAGIAGALYATALSFVEPDMMAFHISSMILTMAILGGAGSVPGAFLGASLIIGYDKVLIPQFGTLVAFFFPHMPIGSVPNLRGASFLTFGLALYLTVLWRARRTKS